MNSWNWRIVVLTLGSTLAFAAVHVEACTCSRLGPAPCQGLTKEDVLFVGTVIDIENPPTEKPRDQAGDSRYRFRIDEVISGVAGPEVDVHSGRGGGDCSYHFVKGKQYLVTPYRGAEGRLVATICSDTRPIEFASALLPQLRAMRDKQLVANLFGTLRRTQQPFESIRDESFDQPLANTTVELRAEGHTHRTTTDANGLYKFYDLPAGTYRFWADLPPHLELAQTILDDPLPPLELPASACYEHDLDALPTGRIRGRVIGPDGRPLPSAAVDLFRFERYDESKPAWYTWWESQRRNGYFEFNHLAPGRYILVFNLRNQFKPEEPFPRAFYPGVPDKAAAGIIALREGQQFLDADIHVGSGRATRQIIVRVLWNGSIPPKDVYLTADGNEGRRPVPERVSPGLFRVTLLRNVLYRIFAHQDCGLRWEGNTGYPIGRIETQPTVIDGSDDRTPEITVTYEGRGCPFDAKPYGPLPQP